MKTVTNQYIVNLALADEFFLIGIPFLITTMIYGNWSEVRDKRLESLISNYFQASGSSEMFSVRFTW